MYTDIKTRREITNERRAARQLCRYRGQKCDRESVQLSTTMRNVSDSRIRPGKQLSVKRVTSRVIPLDVAKISATRAFDRIQCQRRK